LAPGLCPRTLAPQTVRETSFASPQQARSASPTKLRDNRFPTRSVKSSRVALRLFHPQLLSNTAPAICSSSRKRLRSSRRPSPLANPRDADRADISSPLRNLVRASHSVSAAPENSALPQRRTNQMPAIAPSPQSTLSPPPIFDLFPFVSIFRFPEKEKGKIKK